MTGLDKTIEEIESKIKKSCKNVEIAYKIQSGNRWIFLFLNGKQNEKSLSQMQAIYRKLYRKFNIQT